MDVVYGFVKVCNTLEIKGLVLFHIYQGLKFSNHNPVTSQNPNSFFES